MKRAAAALLLLAACSAPGAEGGSEPPRLHHEILIHHDLASADVRVRIQGSCAAVLLGAGRDADAITDLRAGADGTPLSADGARVTLPRGTGLLTYRVALDAFARGQLWMTDQGATLIMEPDDLLVRSAGHGADDVSVTADVTVPPGMHLATSWRTGPDGRLAVPASTFFARGHLVVHPRPPLVVDAAGCRLEVVRLAELAADDAALETWLRQALEAVAEPFGSFPCDRVLVLLRPNRGYGGPVSFGTALHGGGPTLVLHMNPDVPGDALPGEWIAVHELTHLAMPRIRTEDVWMSEGFATYYQEVLRARAGMLDPERCWQRMRQGFERGRRQSGRDTLRQDSQEMARRHLFHRVYWSGAALALQADVALRRRGRSLDEAMVEMMRAFGAGRRPVTAAEILAHLDRWLGEPLLTPLAERALASREFPDVEAALRERMQAPP